MLVFVVCELYDKDIPGHTAADVYMYMSLEKAFYFFSYTVAYDGIQQR